MDGKLALQIDMDGYGWTRLADPSLTNSCPSKKVTFKFCPSKWRVDGSLGEAMSPLHDEVILIEREVGSQFHHLLQAVHGRCFLQVWAVKDTKAADHLSVLKSVKIIINTLYNNTILSNTGIYHPYVYSKLFQTFIIVRQ